ncbi:hypothetical protein [Tsukamurella hominis]|uniref:hypothetical protein n=1 Tax=Tsukamurella hominis TaxID=1970232 RepID=UPI0039E91976
MRDDPAAAAWRAAGRPALPGVPLRVDAEPCARCGDAGETARSAVIVSEQFTGFDQWPYGMRRLCTPCAWAHTAAAPTARTVGMITPTETRWLSTNAALAGELTAGPLPATAAAVLSVSRQQYVLPHAEWGRLTCDRLSIDWTADQARRLEGAAWLRELGFSWAALGRRQPPHPGLRQHPPALWMEIGRVWHDLAPWRPLPSLWGAARLLTAT